MVENETKCIFVTQNRSSMNSSLTGLMKISGQACCRIIDHTFAIHCPITIRNGFFFLLVTGGKAVVRDDFRSYEIFRHHLLVLTPSTKSMLGSMSKDFEMVAVYISPDYFDSIPDGQPVYNQVSYSIGNYFLPIFQLDEKRAEYLQQTMALFSGQLYDMHLYRDGLIRHLCSFLLLQITDALCMENKDTSVCVRRTCEIFRNFKKLLVNHYRNYHDIMFYADQLHISTTYLSRIVKQQTGHTVRFHITELLCADARKLLECTDMDIKEIADYLGFSNQSVFGKFFIKKMGLSPLKFRLRKERNRQKAV